MRKTILVALTVLLVSTSCFAQEVEPDGLFGVERTYWEGPVFSVGIFLSPLYIGFYGRRMYWCNGDNYFAETCSPVAYPYIDIFALTFFSINKPSPFGSFNLYGTLIPSIGIGWGVGYVSMRTFLSPVIVILIKTSDTWTPSE